MPKRKKPSNMIKCGGCQHLLETKGYDERPFLPWVPLGAPAGKRTMKAWLLSDLYKRIAAKKRQPGSE